MHRFPTDARRAALSSWETAALLVEHDARFFDELPRHQLTVHLCTIAAASAQDEARRLRIEHAGLARIMEAEGRVAAVKKRTDAFMQRRAPQVPPQNVELFEHSALRRRASGH
jgi:hypothetical protein